MIIFKYDRTTYSFFELEDALALLKSKGLKVSDVKLLDGSLVDRKVSVERLEKKATRPKKFSALTGVDENMEDSDG